MCILSNFDKASLTISVELAMPTNKQYCSISNNYNDKAEDLPSNFAGRSSLTVLAVVLANLLITKPTVPLLTMQLTNLQAQ